MSHKQMEYGILNNYNMAVCKISRIQLWDFAIRAHAQTEITRRMQLHPKGTHYSLEWMLRALDSNISTGARNSVI